MEQRRTPRGWHLHHHEQLFFKASAGAPTLRIKFYHYPSYRQEVHLDHTPPEWKLRSKGNNTFFLFQKKVQTKGMLSFERTVTVFPTPYSLPSSDIWGRISDIPKALQQKYQQSYPYWPTNSRLIQDVAGERWFSTDNLSEWVRAVSTYIITKIKYAEEQDKRLGADEALTTGTGDCDEFTDVLMTFARIRGIPCRRLTGYHITKEGKDIEPHAWAELFSPQIGWIPVDLALHTIGPHTVSYVIKKIEEFTPSLLDFQAKSLSRAVQYHWETPLPLVTPVY